MGSGRVAFSQELWIAEALPHEPSMYHRAQTYKLELCERWGARAFTERLATGFVATPPGSVVASLPYFPGHAVPGTVHSLSHVHSRPAKLMPLSHFTDEEAETQPAVNRVRFQTQG